MSPRSPWQVRLVNPDNLNTYAYAGNNPINLVDSGNGNPYPPPLPGLDQEENADSGNPPQQGQQQQTTSCREAIAATGVGAATTIGMGAAIYYTGGEAIPALDEGAEGLLSLLHLSEGAGKLMIGPLTTLGFGISQLGACF